MTAPACVRVGCIGIAWCDYCGHDLPAPTAARDALRAAIADLTPAHRPVLARLHALIFPTRDRTTMLRPTIDLHTSTVDGAAAFETARTLDHDHPYGCRCNPCVRDEFDPADEAGR